MYIPPFVLTAGLFLAIIAGFLLGAANQDTPAYTVGVVIMGLNLLLRGASACLIHQRVDRAVKLMTGGFKIFVVAFFGMFIGSCFRGGRPPNVKASINGDSDSIVLCYPTPVKPF